MDVSHVIVQNVFSFESVTTEWTWQFFISVNDLVSPQVIIVPKSHATSLTGKPWALVVFPFLMLFQEFSRPE